MSTGLPTTIAFVVLNLNILCAIAVIFVERKNPVSAVAWLITFLLLPGFGYILYIVFGAKPKFRKKGQFKEKDIYDQIYKKLLIDQCNMLSKGIMPATNPATLLSAPLLKYSTIGAESFYTEDNQVEIFTCATEKFERLIEDINNAQSSISMIYFIYRNDVIGKRIADALTQKAKEGVEVRLVVDDVGSLTSSTKKLFKEFIEAGGQFRRFGPVLSLGRINFRNHRKIAVIDGKIGYIGGMNIGDEYMGLRKRMSNWRDTHLRIIGPAVYILQIRFLLDWQYVSKETLSSEQITRLFSPELPKISENVGINIISSGPDRKEEYIKSAYIAMMYDAKEKIYIQTPYFVPDEPFIECLRTMAMSGVEINIMIPGVWDKYPVYKATTSFLEDLVPFDNVNIYIYHGFIHSKVVAVDENVISIGTCNIDIRSFALHFEVNAFMYDFKLARKHIEIFNEDIKNSHLLTYKEYINRPVKDKVLESIFRLFTPLF